MSTEHECAYRYESNYCEYCGKHRKDRERVSDEELSPRNMFVLCVPIPGCSRVMDSLH